MDFVPTVAIFVGISNRVAKSCYVSNWRGKRHIGIFVLSIFHLRRRRRQRDIFLPVQ